MNDNVKSWIHREAVHPNSGQDRLSRDEGHSFATNTFLIGLIGHLGLNDSSNSDRDVIECRKGFFLGDLLPLLTGDQ